MIFAAAGLTLNDAFNKVTVPGHRGPHPEYNALVWSDLSAAVSKLGPNPSKAKLSATIVKTIVGIGVQSRLPGTQYNRLLMKK